MSLCGERTRGMEQDRQDGCMYVYSFRSEEEPKRCAFLLKAVQGDYVTLIKGGS